MLGQLFDPLGQNGYLGTRTTGVVLMNLRALNGGGFLLGCYHVQTFYQMGAPKATRTYPKPNVETCRPLTGWALSMLNSPTLRRRNALV